MPEKTVENRPIGVDSIKIKVGNKSFDLTAEEARKLWKELDALFGNEISEKIKEYIPCPYPVAPIIVEPYKPYWRPQWEITWGDPMKVTCGGVGGTSISFGGGGALAVTNPHATLSINC